MKYSNNKISFKHILIAISFLTIFSCEKVIEIDIKDAETQLVVEANINSGAGNNYVILSKSGNFYGSNTFPKVKNALVTIYDKNGTGFILSEVEDGIYNHPNLDGIENNLYKLDIRVENKIINGESTMPVLIPIDSLSYKEVNKPFGGGNGSGEQTNTSYKLFCHFKDPAGVRNYYRFRVYESFYQDYQTFIINDDLFDGKYAMTSLFGITAVPGDSIRVEMYSIDKANYEYYRLLDANDMGAFTTSIGNPVSNVSGENVIGVFGANSVDTSSIVLPGNLPSIQIQ